MFKEEMVAKSSETMAAKRGRHELCQAVLMSVLVVCTSCSEETPEAPGTIDGGTPGGGRTTASESIGIAGGTVETSTGASVTVSPNALVEETTLTVTELSSTPGQVTSEQTQDAGQATIIQPWGNIYEFTPHGQTFAEPVTIRMPYASFVPESLESQIKIYWAESLEGPWRALQTSEVDPQTNSVWGQVSSFSYGVAATAVTDASILSDGDPPDGGTDSGGPLANDGAADVAIEADGGDGSPADSGDAAPADSRADEDTGDGGDAGPADGGGYGDAGDGGFDTGVDSGDSGLDSGRDVGTADSSPVDSGAESDGGGEDSGEPVDSGSGDGGPPPWGPEAPGPWVLIDVSGTPFPMGSPDTELGRYTSETQHEVTLTRNYWLMSREITQQQYLDVMGYNPSWYSVSGTGADCGLNCPLEMVNWYEIAAYTNTLSGTEGLGECYDCTGTAPATINCSPSESYGTPYDCPGYRLPMEAEWEYAARGGTTTATYAGDLTATDCTDTTLGPIAWFCGNASTTTHPVGVKTPNAYGLYDMLGNVTEWCHDWYATYPSDPVTDPLGATSGSYRVPRGGSWAGHPRNARAAYRNGNGPAGRSRLVGGRAVRSVPL